MGPFCLLYPFLSHSLRIQPLFGIDCDSIYVCWQVVFGRPFSGSDQQGVWDVDRVETDTREKCYFMHSRNSSLSP